MVLRKLHYRLTFDAINEFLTLFTGRSVDIDKLLICWSFAYFLLSIEIVD